MSHTIILPILIIFITLTLSVIVLVSNVKDKRNRSLALLIFLGALWIASNFLADHSTTYSTALFWTQFAIIPPAVGLPLFLYFSLIFPEERKKCSWKLIFALFLPSCIYILLFQSSLNVSNIILQSWGTDYIPGLLYNLFIPYFLLYFGMTLYTLKKAYSLGNLVAKAQIAFVVLGLLSAFVVGMVTNIIFPILGQSDFAVFGPSFAILFLAAFTTYAILKHHLFNIKVIAAEMLTFAIWIFLLVQFVLDPTFTNGILLVLVIFFGILLIRSVMNEIMLNVKLKEADKLKTEFLGLASHQLRSPLTAIKGTASMLLEGSYGKIDSPDQYKQIDNIFKSSNSLIRIIEDLLDVSKIEQGGMKYQMQMVDMKVLAQELVDELSVSAKSKGLALILNDDDIDSYLVNADADKIRQVLLNLIDNAIKYTAKGNVTVLLKHAADRKIQICISDTGIGMNGTDINKLFEKFSRLDNGKLNTGGSGLGLYLAKEIVVAHNGKIWVESPGSEKGATFYIELPQYITGHTLNI